MTPNEALAAWLSTRPEAQTSPPRELRADKAGRPGTAQRWTSRGSGEISWRLDASTIVRHDNGWIDITGVATRAGVFVYAQADGSDRLELRPEVEVFDSRSMASLVGVPFTNNHPAVALDSQNTQQHQVGTVLAVARRDDLLEARIRLTAASVVQDVADGKVELSGGYSTDVLDQAGELNGETFDAIQTNIRYNHLALVDEARAGPVARLRLDRGDAVQKAPTMKTTITIRSKSYQVDAAQLTAVMSKASASGLRADALETEAVTIGGADLILPLSMVEQMLAALTGGVAEMPAPEVEEMEAGDLGEELGVEEVVEADASEHEEEPKVMGARLNAADRKRMDRLERRLDAMPATVRQQMTNRGRIERIAAQVLPSNYRYDNASDVKVMADAIAQVNPDMKTRCDSAAKAGQVEFLRGMFELAIDGAVAERNDGNDVLTSLTGNTDPVVKAPTGKVTRIDEARRKYYDRIQGRTAPKPEEGAA